MFQKMMQAIMPAEKMIDMFTFDIRSNLSIDKISENVPEACEKHNFALLKTYN